MLGIVMTAVGGAGLLWGGFCLLTGASHARIDVTYDFSVTPLPAGLAGAALLTVGVFFIRD
jgi:hypothetical protein